MVTKSKTKIGVKKAVKKIAKKKIVAKPRPAKKSIKVVKKTVVKKKERVLK